LIIDVLIFKYLVLLFAFLLPNEENHSCFKRSWCFYTPMRF